MILSMGQQDQDALTYAKINDAVRGILQRSSVKLYGITSGATFTGSGVLLYSTEGEALVVTAKHNLYIFAGKSDPPSWSNDTVNSFQQSIKIYYDAAMDFGRSPASSAPITSIVPVNVDPEDNPWLYDVMILKSTDSALNTFASKNGCFTQTSLEDHGKFMSNHVNYLKRGTQSDSRYFIQTGFGKVRDTGEDSKKTVLPVGKAGKNVEGAFQFRVTDPLGAESVTVYQQSNKSQFYPYAEAVQLTADTTSSTAPGDSGGPLFVTFYDRLTKFWKLYLIGVTTGANMAASEIRCPTPPAIVENNISTSLRYCYQNNLFD